MKSGLDSSACILIEARTRDIDPRFSRVVGRRGNTIDESRERASQCQDLIVEVDRRERLDCFHGAVETAPLKIVFDFDAPTAPKAPRARCGGKEGHVACPKVLQLKGNERST